MPNPITCSDRSLFSSPGAFETGDACNPELASCGPPPAAAAEVPRSVTIAPVDVTGESDSAARQLVRRHDASASPGCGPEQAKAVLSCTLAATTAVGTALTTPSGIGLVLGLIGTARTAAQCAGDVSLALECKDRSEAIANANADCTARGGVLLTGANTELICQVTR